MSFCASCGTRSEESARFCSGCGKPLAEQDGRTASVESTGMQAKAAPLVRATCSEGRHYACGYQDCECECHTTKPGNKKNSFQWGFDIASALVFLLFAFAYVSAGKPGLLLIAYPMYWIGAYVYTLPARLAFKDEKNNRVAILSFDLLLGWTFIGWVIALTWALAKERSVC